MATSKPISTISYNTEDFLKEKLNELYEQHIIQAYMYIKHIGEGGDKDHIHLRIEPNKRIDPMDIRAILTEYKREPGDEEVYKQTTVRPFRPSKEEDWFLYAVHDPQYMKIKYDKDNLEKLPYQDSDIVTSPDYDLRVAMLRARQYLHNTSANVLKQIEEGKSARELIAEGRNVFAVNGILASLKLTEFERLANNYNKLQQEHEALLQALEVANIQFAYDDKGNCEIIL